MATIEHFEYECWIDYVDLHAVEIHSRGRETTIAFSPPAVLRRNDPLRFLLDWEDGSRPDSIAIVAEGPSGNMRPYQIHNGSNVPYSPEHENWLKFVRDYMVENF